MKIFLSLLIFAMGSLGFAKTTPVKNSAKAVAAPNKIRVPTSVPTTGGFKFEVTFGDKRTQFLVWSDSQGKYFSATNGGRSNTGNLSEKNFKFLKDQSSKIGFLPVTSIKSCPNKNMKISMKGGSQSRSACLGTKTQTAMKMTEMANVLSLLL